MVMPDGFCYGNLGGYFAAVRKNAGYDGVVFTGRAKKPCYLWIEDGKAGIMVFSRPTCAFKMWTVAGQNLLENLNKKGLIRRKGAGDIGSLPIRAMIYEGPTSCGWRRPDVSRPG